MFPFMRKQKTKETAQEHQQNVVSYSRDAKKAVTLIEEVAFEKSFDWTHYERTLTEPGIWSDEHRMAPDARIMLSIYAKESLVRIGIDAIAKQFFSAEFVSKDARLLAQLSKPNNSESSAEFHYCNIVMLIATGNLFIFHDRNSLVRIPTDRMSAKFASDGRIERYIMQGMHTSVEIPVENILHIKWPNPISHKIGLSPLSALPAFVLMDKYASELSISYYLRGGMLSGVLETEVDDNVTLSRLRLSLQQGNGSRRNSFSDKILPQGVKWKAASRGLSDSLVLDNSKLAQRRILAVLGVPPVMVGDTDSVNYANAVEQRATFWRETMLPVQTLYCNGLSKLSTTDEEVSVDNSKVAELSTFAIRLEQDAKLAPVLSIDERRARLGFGLASQQTQHPAAKSFVTGYESAGEFPSLVQAQQEIDYKKLGWYEAPDRGYDAVKQYLMRVLDGYLEGDSAPQLGEGFSREFATYFAESIRQEMADAWDTAAKHTFSNTDGRAAAIVSELRNAQLNIAKSMIEEQGARNFVGFSETMTKRIESRIIAATEEGRSLAEIRLNLKQTFGEEYANQMRTIANTEFRSAMSLVNEQFGQALGTVAKVMSKRWVSMDDRFVRDDHQTLHEKVLTGTAEEIREMNFDKFLGQGITLRYPRDSAAGAGQVINCRCVLLWSVEEYK